MITSPSPPYTQLPDRVMKHNIADFRQLKLHKHKQRQSIVRYSSSTVRLHHYSITSLQRQKSLWMLSYLNSALFENIKKKKKSSLQIHTNDYVNVVLEHTETQQDAHSG